jgi:hypothetical protein
MAFNIVIETAGLSEDLQEYFSDLLKRKILARTRVVFTNPTASDLIICLSLDPTIPEDGFRIQDRKAGDILITGANRRGLMYGIGKFLRSAVYDDVGQEIQSGAWRGLSRAR